MIVEFHIIQNFAPSNLNRDDSNTPKDCEFGGCRRARISSQCIKRSLRNHDSFKNAVRDAGGSFGTRTKRIIAKISELLIQQYGKPEDESLVVAKRAVALFGVKRDDKQPEKTSILLYLGENEISDIAEIASKNDITLLASEISVEEEIDESAEEEKGGGKKKKKSPKPTLTAEQKAIQKELQKVVGEARLKNAAYAADIALYGRMVADKNVKNMNVVAACQVAHAISTHKVEMEMDYFTAVDDLLPGEDTGSDMIGVVEFNSSCFYRYSLIDINKLQKNLGFNDDLLKATVLGYLEASVKAIPTGKQNSMAAQNPPAFARVIIRKDAFPWSLANAFQKPVFSSRDASIEEKSINALNSYFDKLTKTYGGESVVCDTCFNLYDPDSQTLQNVLQNVAFALSPKVTA